MGYLIFALVWAILGCIVYRMRGGFGVSLPRPIEQILFCALVCAPVTPFLAFLVVLAICTIACVTGHGSYMDLTRGDQYQPGDDERIAPVVRWICKVFGINSNPDTYAYQAIGLALTGLIVTLPAGIASGAFFLAIVGAVKFPVYELGWTIGERFPAVGAKLARLSILRDHQGRFAPTAFGEAAFGFVVCAVAGLTLASKVL